MLSRLGSRHAMIPALPCPVAALLTHLTADQGCIQIHGFRRVESRRGAALLLMLLVLLLFGMLPLLQLP